MNPMEWPQWLRVVLSLSWIPVMLIWARIAWLANKDRKQWQKLLKKAQGTWAEQQVYHGSAAKEPVSWPLIVTGYSLLSDSPGTMRAYWADLTERFNAYWHGSTKLPDQPFAIAIQWASNLNYLDTKLRQLEAQK